MSDALTNSEIEDVLTSVRRLVTHDTRRGDTGPAAGTEGGRLILTQAQRIDPVNAGAPKAEVTVAKDARPAAEHSAPPPKPAATPLTKAPDFRRLEATIAELEAAVSASGSVFEPDGSEAAPASNVTALYAKPSFLHTSLTEGFSSPPAPIAAPAPAAPTETGTPAMDVVDGDGFDDDDDLFETVIDEATLRILVAQIVREELQGQLGERITLQVRKLVRSEIAKALDSRDLI